MNSSENSKYKAFEEPNLCYKVDKALISKEEVTLEDVCQENNLEVKEKAGLFFDLLYANQYNLRQA